MQLSRAEGTIGREIARLPAPGCSSGSRFCQQADDGQVVAQDSQPRGGSLGPRGESVDRRRTGPDQGEDVELDRRGYRGRLR